MNSKNTNTKFSFGCLAFILLIWIIAYLFGQTKKRQERQAEKEIEYQRQIRQQKRNTAYENLLPKDTAPTEKTRKLTPKQQRELEEESQYEWDVREEAEGQMDERGIDEPY